MTRPAVWYAGLDLGKVKDATSLSVLEPSGPRLYVTLLRTWKPERDDCIDALGEVLRLVDRDRPERNRGDNFHLLGHRIAGQLGLLDQGQLIRRRIFHDSGR